VIVLVGPHIEITGIFLVVLQLRYEVSRNGVPVDPVKVVMLLDVIGAGVPNLE
jgi:hypothetical protein